MIRKTDIKRLWDALLILKHEEDIDDVRKRGANAPPVNWREDLESGSPSAATQDEAFSRRQAELNREKSARTSGTSPYPGPPTYSLTGDSSDKT